MFSHQSTGQLAVPLMQGFHDSLMLVQGFAYILQRLQREDTLSIGKILETLHHRSQLAIRSTLYEECMKRDFGL